VPNTAVPELPALPATTAKVLRVAAPQMPRLPKTPLPAWAKAMIPAKGMPKVPPRPEWDVKPSAKLVQQQYVETRMEELAAQRSLGRNVALDLLEKLLQRRGPTKRQHEDIPFKELLRIYKAIQLNLQSAELTVNFKCETWFEKENPYDSYTQMYQRAVKGRTMILKNTDLNDADLRAYADNMVTFPKSWKSELVPRERGDGPGLTPGRQTPRRIQKQMDTGELVQINKDDELPAFLAGNPHFNPHTKQVFLALNYGRRPHGSAFNYGYSYFVAKHELKPECFYYAQDTFMRAGKGVDAGAIQVVYDNLGVLLESGGSPFLMEAILESCYEGQVLPDLLPENSKECKYFLIEAHRFGDFEFDKHVDYMVISPRGLSDSAVWPTVVANAKSFTKRNKIRLYETD